MKIVFENRWTLCYSSLEILTISWGNYFEIIICNFAFIFYFDN